MWSKSADSSRRTQQPNELVDAVPCSVADPLRDVLNDAPTGELG
jgi:hypothetical protein